jgi:hypothetical protein
MKYVALIAAAILGYVFYRSLPDIQRYMRIRSM